MLKISGFSLPGYNDDSPDALPLAEASDSKAPVYKIPPVLWMVIFLVVGYIGLRWVMED
jgi:hypothetical protein